MKIAICDDNIPFGEGLKKKLLRYKEGFQKIDIYTSGSQLSKSNEQYDIIFMDIDLKESITGIGTAKFLKGVFPNSLLIYMSSYDRYYVDLANAESFRFLPKPLDEEKFHEALDAAVGRINDSVRKYYYYTFNKVQTKVDLNDVLYFMSDHRKIIIRKQDGSEAEFYGKLEDIYPEVNEIYPYFIQINKSAIVNFIKADRYQKSEVFFGDMSIPISRTYEKEYHHRKYEIMMNRK